jgi:hypothetical protein
MKKRNKAPLIGSACRDSNRNFGRMHYGQTVSEVPESAKVCNTNQRFEGQCRCEQEGSAPPQLSAK